MRRASGVVGGGGWDWKGCPGIACNKFYSLFKGGRSVFKTCTSFTKRAVIEYSSGISNGE